MSVCWWGPIKYLLCLHPIFLQNFGNISCLPLSLFSFSCPCMCMPFWIFLLSFWWDFSMHKSKCMCLKAMVSQKSTWCCILLSHLILNESYVKGILAPSNIRKLRYKYVYNSCARLDSTEQSSNPLIWFQTPCSCLPKSEHLSKFMIVISIAPSPYYYVFPNLQLSMSFTK